MGVCCHEAYHACENIEDDIGMEHGGEPSAYLIGWIASCINKARLGIGDFVEIVDKEEKQTKGKIPFGVCPITIYNNVVVGIFLC